MTVGSPLSVVPHELTLSVRPAMDASAWSLHGVSSAGKGSSGLYLQTVAACSRPHHLNTLVSSCSPGTCSALAPGEVGPHAAAALPPHRQRFGSR